jgi:urease accessory protein
VLLHLTDSLFPIGSFAHSDGLESATQSGAVSTAEDLEAWLDVSLDQIVGRMEGPALAASWSAARQRSLERLAAIDEELTALRPAAAGRRASRAMGLRLTTGWHACYPSAIVESVLALAQAGKLGPGLPVAFGVACASADVSVDDSISAYAYSRLAATVSAAMRLMSIGQSAAHGVLARALIGVPAVVAASLGAVDDAGTPRLECFSPAMDMAAMAQAHLHSRLFLS